MAEDYDFYDDDIESFTDYGDDVVEIGFRGSDGVEAINLHKNDIVYLAKHFGLIVYERDSAL